MRPPHRYPPAIDLAQPDGSVVHIVLPDKSKQHANWHVTDDGKNYGPQWRGKKLHWLRIVTIMANRK